MAAMTTKEQSCTAAGEPEKNACTVTNAVYPKFHFHPLTNTALSTTGSSLQPTTKQSRPLPPSRPLPIQPLPGNKQRLLLTLLHPRRHRRPIPTNLPLVQLIGHLLNNALPPLDRLLIRLLAWGLLIKPLAHCLNHPSKPIEIQRMQDDIAGQVHQPQPERDAGRALVRELHHLRLRAQAGVGAHAELAGAGDEDL